MPSAEPLDFDSSLNFATEEWKKTATGIYAGVPARVRVFDARARYGVLQKAQFSTLGEDLLLRGRGYLLAHTPSKVTDWYDPEDVMRHYYKEVVEMARQLLPNFKFVDLPQTQQHIIRREENGYGLDIKNPFGKPGVGVPASAVHNDYADRFAERPLDEDNYTVTTRVKEQFAGFMSQSEPKSRHGLADTSKMRMVVLNCWKSIAPEPMVRTPLTVCDKRSLHPADLWYGPNHYAPPGMDLCTCSPSSVQKWSYYPKMLASETLVFLGYDSEPPGGGIVRSTMHSAVHIPGTKGLPQRQSLEMRLMGYQDMSTTAQCSARL
jgi:hypothetical protein